MPGGVDTQELQRKLAKLAILSQRGIAECVQDGAKRFITKAVKNTMPMILRESPGTTKKNWAAKISQYLETHRKTPKGYRRRADVQRHLTYKLKQLGREASGWNAAAQALKVGVPAWVKRHGCSEGAFHQETRKDSARITVTNSVPYNEDMTQRRAEYALQVVNRGLDGNLRAIKRKLLRSFK